MPSFDVAQRVYENLPLEILDDHFADLMAAGYSVSMFTDWRAPRLTQLWIKQRLDAPPAAPGPALGPRPAGPRPAGPRPAGHARAMVHRHAGPAPRHPVPGVSADACTEQLGLPGRWYERLPHFRPELRPSVGRELQSEYLLPVAHAVPALHALSQIRDRLAPVLRICEIRVVAADELWLSPSYRRRTAWRSTSPGSPTPPRCCPVVALAERQLAPFAPRPHWGKIFTTPPEALRARYERLPDFLALMRRLDPSGKFRNAYTTRYLGRLASDSSPRLAAPSRSLTRTANERLVLVLLGTEPLSLVRDARASDPCEPCAPLAPQLPSRRFSGAPGWKEMWSKVAVQPSPVGD